LPAAAPVRLRPEIVTGLPFGSQPQPGGDAGEIADLACLVRQGARYCDPIQIIGDDQKKGYIFLEWSKDDMPRFFRYAIRPLFHIWNPNNLQWADIPAAKKPMVEVARAPFSRDKWTHVAFTLENINDKSEPPSGKLFINGKLQGAIENWDLTFDWDPAKVLLVLGASYVGHMDDLAVFDRPLTAIEVERVYGLKTGIRELYP
jgi:hypothetical protein